MAISLAEVAQLTQLPEPTLRRWVRLGLLPVVRSGTELRFARATITERIAECIRAEANGATAAKEPIESSSLCGAVERGGIHHDLGGETRGEVLNAVAELPGIPSKPCRQEIARLLIERESLASTAFEGVAVPHPSQSALVPVEQPIVLLCTLQKPVDFLADDGKPATALVVMFSSSPRTHLRMLSKISRSLGSGPLRGLLDERAALDVVVDRIWAFEDAASPLSRGRYTR
jgi:PTS system nitrogen regulatory IIA component